MVYKDTEELLANGTIEKDGSYARVYSLATEC